MANKALDYINSGSLDHARSNPGIFDGLATAAMTAGNFITGPVGLGLKAAGAIGEGAKFVYNWHQDKKKDKKSK